jgi:hypothetical protein
LIPDLPARKAEIGGRVLRAAANCSAETGSRHNDSFWVTPEGGARLDDGQPGALFAGLFIALFRESRLKYFDRFDVNETLLWSSLPACFYMLGRHATDWKSAGQAGSRHVAACDANGGDCPLPAWAGHQERIEARHGVSSQFALQTIPALG